MCRFWEEDYAVLPISAYEDINDSCCKCRCHLNLGSKSDQYTQVDSDFLDSEIGELCEVVLTEPGNDVSNTPQLTKKNVTLSQTETATGKTTNPHIVKVTKTTTSFGTSPVTKKIKPNPPPTIIEATEESNSSTRVDSPQLPDSSTSSESEDKDPDDPKDPVWISKMLLEKFKPRSKREKLTSYDCDVCDKSFKTRRSLRQHKRYHVPEEKRFKCSQCDWSFPLKATLRTHEKTHSGIKPFKCDICDLRFLNASNLKRHVRTHTGERPYQCTTCGDTFSNGTALKTHEAKHSDERPYACEKCPMRFKLSHHLKQHTMVHTGEKPFLCNICGIATKRHAQHMFHLKTHEPKSKEPPTVFKCDKCGITFRYRAALNDHVMDIHEGTNTILQCPECPLTFYTKSKYKKHVIAHTENKFQCEECGLRCKSITALKLHKMNHSGEKPYKCKYCDYSAKLKTACIQHERIHTGEKPFECETCGKKFRIKNHLAQHILTHIDARPFKCELCDGTFRRPAALQQHMQTHTKEKPYACDICDTNFRSKVNLVKHKNEQHPIDDATTSNYPTEYQMFTVDGSFQTYQTTEDIRQNSTEYDGTTMVLHIDYGK